MCSIYSWASFRKCFLTRELSTLLQLTLFVGNSFHFVTVNLTLFLGNYFHEGLHTFNLFLQQCLLQLQINLKILGSLNHHNYG